MNSYEYFTIIESLEDFKTNLEGKEKKSWLQNIKECLKQNLRQSMQVGLNILKYRWNHYTSIYYTSVKGE